MSIIYIVHKNNTDSFAKKVRQPDVFTLSK